MAKVFPKEMLERFVRLWQGAETAEEVGRQVGLDTTRAISCATRLRKRGVKLKKMPRSRPSVDVDSLNRIIDRLTK